MTPTNPTQESRNLGYSLLSKEAAAPTHSSPSISQYLSNHGNQCLYCQSESMTSGPPLTSDDSTLTCVVKCHKCSRSWTDIYTLSGVHP